MKVHAIACSILFLSSLVACGGGDEDTSSSKLQTSPSTSGGTSGNCSGSYPQISALSSSRLSKNQGGAQCTTVLQAAESLRQAALAACAAGNASAAATNYTNYKKYGPIADTNCL